jgi:hypothetical protein
MTSALSSSSGPTFSVQVEVEVRSLLGDARGGDPVTTPTPDPLAEPTLPPDPRRADPTADR